MTGTSTPAARRPRRLVVPGVLVVAALVLAPALVWWSGHRAALQVVAATGFPDCVGTKPRTVEGFDDGFRQVAIPTVQGFRCTIPVRVSNRSEHEVTVGRVTVPVAGPYAGGSFEVRSVSGLEVPAGDEVDAVVDVDLELEAGDSALVELDVVFRESGCTSEGGTMHVSPSFEVKDTVARRDLVVADLPAFLGTADSSCDT